MDEKHSSVASSCEASSFDRALPTRPLLPAVSSSSSIQSNTGSPTLSRWWRLTVLLAVLFLVLSVHNFGARYPQVRDLVAGRISSSASLNQTVVVLPTRPRLGHPLPKKVAPKPDIWNSFLLPARIGEQESKAQTHLYQLGLLAVALNRTLVLPRMSASRFVGACSNDSSAFDDFYDRTSLSKLGIPTILQGEFDVWLASQDDRPSTSTVAFDPKARRQEGLVEEQDDSDLAQDILESGCFDSSLFRRDNRVTAVNASISASSSTADLEVFGVDLVHHLQRTSSSRSKVLAVTYDFRFPILSPDILTLLDRPPPLPFNALVYQPYMHSLASTISSRMETTVAVHWRIETVPVSRIRSCASSLVDNLVALRRANPSLSTIYLATDYPFDALLLNPATDGYIRAHSGTFTKSLTREHQRAMRGLLGELRARAFPLGLRLTTLDRERASLDEEEAATGTEGTVEGLEDRSVAAIIDQLVVREADFFLAGMQITGVSGARDGCGKRSSFTDRIIEAREATRGAEGKQVVDFFGLDLESK